MTVTPMTAGYRLVRLVALGVMIALAAYWAGSRWGPRQPLSVEATPGAQPAQNPAPNTSQLTPEETVNVKIYSKSAPAVANIVTRALEYDVFFDPVAVNGAGSGFIFDARGYILTNHHVIADAQQIEVTLGDRSHYTAKVVGSDERNDVALLKIEPPQGK